MDLRGISVLAIISRGNDMLIHNSVTPHAKTAITVDINADFFTYLIPCIPRVMFSAVMKHGMNAIQLAPVSRKKPPVLLLIMG